MTQERVRVVGVNLWRAHLSNPDQRADVEVRERGGEVSTANVEKADESCGSDGRA